MFHQVLLHTVHVNDTIYCHKHYHFPSYSKEVKKKNIYIYTSSYDPIKNVFLKINCLSKGMKMLISIQVEFLVCYTCMLKK